MEGSRREVTAAGVVGRFDRLPESSFFRISGSEFAISSTWSSLLDLGLGIFLLASL